MDLTRSILQIRRAIRLASVIFGFCGLKKFEVLASRAGRCTRLEAWVVCTGAKLIRFGVADLLRLHKFPDGLVKVGSEAPEELFIMWSIPIHISLKVELRPSLLVDVVASRTHPLLLSLELSQLAHLRGLVE